MADFPNDSFMAELARQVPPYETKFDAGTDIYFRLLEQIVSQQISVKAAESIFLKFLDLFPHGYPEAQLLLDMENEELRAASLSFQKITYLRSVAAFSLTHNISYEFMQSLDDEEVIKYLTQINGVGRWTAEMILMFSLNRPDVFPVDDLVVRQTMIQVYQIDTSMPKASIYKKLHEVADRWRPYRSEAVKLLWQYSLNSRKNTQPRFL